MLEELNTRELLPVFLMRVLDLGSLHLTDALADLVGLQTFKALFDTSHFGEASSSMLLKMDTESWRSWGSGTELSCGVCWSGLLLCFIGDAAVQLVVCVLVHCAFWKVVLKKS